MKKIAIIIFPLILILVFLFCIYTFFLENAAKNFVNNSIINRGPGWINNQSSYAGSELTFAFTNSNNLYFKVLTTSNADQGIDILIDNKTYVLSSSIKQSRIIKIDVSRNKIHNVVVKHFCTYLYFPCDITLNEIIMNENAKILPYQPHRKILSVLGDSISTLYDTNNYSQLVAQSLGYELHNASIMGSTVSVVKNEDSASFRYKKDLLDFKSNAIVIFMGTNDVYAQIPLDVFKKNYTTIVSSVKLFEPKTKIFLIGILPRKDIPYYTIQQYNDVINQIATSTNTIYVDTSSWLDESDMADDIHPSLPAQKKIADHLTEVLSGFLN